MSDEINNDVVEDNDVAEESSENLEASESDESSDVSVQANTEEELEEEIQEAIDNGASEEEVKNMIREFTIKVNGKEYKRSIDLSDEETLKRELQLAMAGRHAMQENAELKKDYESKFNKLMNDPFAFLEEVGFDPIQLAAARLDAYVKEQEKSPEEREIEERQKRFRQLEEENKKLKEQMENERRQALLDQAEIELTDEISKALDKYAQLEETPELIGEIADAMYLAMEDGWTDVRAEDVIPSVHERMVNRFKNSLKSLKSKDAIKSVIGDDILNSLREERIEQAKKIASVKNLKTDVSKTIPAETKDDGPKIKLSDLLSGRSRIG